MKKRSRLIVSLLTAFIMAFTVVPYMGGGSQVNATETSYEEAWNNPNWGKTKYDFVKTVTFVLKDDNLYDAKVLLDFSKLTSAEFSAIQESVIRTQWYNTNGGMQTSNFSNAVVGDAKTYEFYSYSGGTRFWFSDLTPGKSIKLRMIVNAFGFDYCPELTISVPVICASGHSWDSGTVTKKATCAATGIKTLTCTVCSTTKTETIPKSTTHSWNTGTVTKAATCAATGVKTLKCTVCSTTKTETIPKSTTHSYSGGACTVCSAVDPSAKVEAAQDKVLGTVTVPKGDYTKKEYYVGQLYLDKSVNTLFFNGVPGTLVIRDSNGNEVVSGKEYLYNEDIDQYITKAGMYKVYAKTASTSGIKDYTYDVTYTLTKDIVYTYKYPYLTATETESGMDKVPAVKIEYGDFDGPTGSVKELAIFREANGKIRKLDTSYYTGLVDAIKIDYGTQYTYYIVDLSYVTGTAKTTLSNVGTVDETLTAAIKTALTDSHVTSNTVKTKDIVLGSVSILKDNAKIGITSVELEWSNALDGWTDSYIMESFNEKGELMQTKEYTDGRFSGNVIYIPYEGVSKVKVTPCYTYKGVKMRNDAGADEISVKSAKIKAPGVNITKISNTKAAITTYKTTGATGVVVQQKVGKKYKTVTTGTIKGTNNKGYKGTTKNTYTKSWTKNKAGKTSYRVCSYIIDQGNVYYSGWKTGIKPKVNKTTYTNYGIGSIVMNGRDVYFRPLKIEYKGSKIKVTGKFYNTWHGEWWAPKTDSGKFKITFKANHGNGKTVGYKTIKSGKMKQWRTKTVTFYLSGAKKAQDLRTVSYSVKTYY